MAILEIRDCESAILDIAVGDRMRRRFCRVFKYTRCPGSPPEQGVTEEQKEMKKENNKPVRMLVLFTPSC